MKAPARIGLLAALLLTGCIEDIIRQFVPVDPTDGEVPSADGGPGGDGLTTTALTLSDVDPDHGPFVGGTEVVISGTGFAGSLTVRFGGTAVQATKVTLLSPIALKVETPPGQVGTADVEVTRGKETAKLPKAFTYDPVSLDPDSGPTVGGTLVTIQGQGTQFKSGMKLELGSAAMKEVEVVSTTLVRAKTPPGATGPATLVYSEGGVDRTVEEAFTYYSSTDPKSGGLGGGPLKGTLTVSVLNSLTRAVVPGATVVVEKERQLLLKGTTDSKGMVVFSTTKLVGPVSATAGRTGFETSTIVDFDARDLTVFLTPLLKPQPGPLPPGTLSGLVQGHVLFGGITGAGGKLWKLVPEPKGGQKKRVYVFATVPSLSWGPPSPSANATIDFDPSQGTTAWPYSISGFVGGIAVWAVAGLYTTQSGTFVPYALGVTRGVVVGPGETAHADVWITAPLTEKVTVQIKDMPAEVTRHSLTLGVDLGADGLIILPEWEAEGDGVPTTVPVSRLPRFTHQGLVDATLTVDVLLESPSSDGLPFARAVERSVLPQSGAILVDEFVGVPRQVLPHPGDALKGNTLAWSQSGAVHDLAVTVLRQSDDTPIWRVISPGTTTRVKLPDPQAHGLPPWPKGDVVWLQWLARLPGFTFDKDFTYNHLSSRYWDRWSFDELEFEVP